MAVRARASNLVRNESGFGLVETMIALTILVIGLVAVSGLSLASAQQARTANWRTQQVAAAQVVLEEIQMAGWASAASGTDTATVAGHDYVVTVSVSTVSSRVKQVAIVVAGVGDVGSVNYSARLYKPLPLPDPIPGP